MITKNTPTPPIQLHDSLAWAKILECIKKWTYPTRIWRGKKPIKVPRRNAPKRKKVKPGVMRHSSSTDVKPNVGLTRKNGGECESHHRGRDDRSRVILAYLLRDTVGDEMEERLWIISEAGGDRSA